MAQLDTGAHHHHKSIAEHAACFGVALLILTVSAVALQWLFGLLP